MANHLERSERSEVKDSSEYQTLEDALKTAEYDQATLRRIGKTPILKVAI